MRVLFFTDGPLSPGSRFRCLQFFPWLEKRGISCEVQFAYGHRYNDVHEKPWAPLYKAGGRLVRAGRLLFERGHDLLFLHKTTMAVTGLPELMQGFRHTPTIFDFDDAIYLGVAGTQSPARERTFRRAVDAAAHVIAGNPHLANQARVPWKTSVIPTVVDTTKYLPGPEHEGRELVIGWIGTASNFPYIRAVLPQVVKALEHLPRARIRIVSNGFLQEYASHPRVEQWRWSEERELMAIQSFDIGLMPLPDTAQTRGKCGFKMLQCMACGVPVVGSAVGANPGLFLGSRAGLLVEPGADWTAPIIELARRPRAVLRAMGTSGRTHVQKQFSVASVVDQYVTTFEQVVAQAHSARAS